MRLSDSLDVAGIAAVAGGLGYRFGAWLAAVVGGALVIVANYIRSDS